MRPLANYNVDDGRLMGSHSAQRDFRADAVGPEALEYLWKGYEPSGK